MISSSFPSSWAEIFFPSTNVRLDGPSSYCVITPKDKLIESKSSDWIKLVENSVLDWETNLKQTETENDSIWEMETKIISEEDKTCDINIEFKDKPNLSDTVAGYFSWPPGKIVIYYLQPKLCTGLIPCYDDKTLKSDDAIYAIVLHEIGHSLGLDHYVSDDNDVNKRWQSGKVNPPSVMIPTIPQNPSLLKITDIDVQKVREIYGPFGFLGFSGDIVPTPQPDISPEPPFEPIIPITTIEALDVSQKLIEIGSHDREIVTISGKISKEEYHRGLPAIITIHKPDDSVEVLKITTTGTGYFETLLIFDRESIRGNYRVSASYDGHVDKKKDVTFEVVDRKVGSSSDPPEPVLRGDNLIPQKQIFPNDEKIPTWIKNNAKWWSDGQIEDRTFVLGMQYLVEQNLLEIPKMNNIPKSGSEMPSWIKIIAGYWGDDLIGEEEFVKSMQYLVSNGIIVIP